jgi:competence ComEA-like helix-hairpin-helix protein
VPLSDELRVVALAILIGGSGLAVSHHRVEALAQAVRSQTILPTDSAEFAAHRARLDSIAATRGQPAVTSAPPTPSTIESRWHARWFGRTADSIVQQPVTSRREPRARRHTAGNAITEPVDMDRASMEEIERLPRVGAALAARIVDYRARCGPFGSLDGLDNVSGIGPALLRTIAGSVTFSGTQRLSHAPGCAGSRRE